MKYKIMQLKKMRFNKIYKSIVFFIKQRPLNSFFVALGLLLLVIIVGHVLNQPKQQKIQQTPVKQVTLYSIGQAPKATFQAKIEKAGVVKIVAQTSGIVQHISVNEGTSVTKGEQLIALSSTYQGGNAPAIQASIAQKQYQNVLDTYDGQQNAVQKQRDIANSTHDNFTEQQNIASQSAGDTQSLIDSNQTVLDTLNQQLTTDKNNNNPTPTITSEESAVNSLQGAQNALKQALRNLQQQTDSAKPPNKLADEQRVLTLAQLNIQEKALALNKEVSALQAAQAAVNADTMFPATPVAGVVERVFVRVGQQVSSGTQLATITSSGDSQTIAVVDVPQEIAQHISRFELSALHINNKVVALKPYFISSDVTDGLLYSIFYTIPDDYIKAVTDGQYITADIPVGSVNSGATIPFLPIDAVYQTQDENYVLVDHGNKAVARRVTLGNVFGEYIAIPSGLRSGDQVIVNRNVVAGDAVRAN